MSKILTLFTILAFAVPALSLTIHVPGEQPTIQAGLDAVAPGDTVLVSCDTYYEHEIQMREGVCLRSETGEPGCVTIDGQGLGRVILCLNLALDPVIEGFTIRGGWAEDVLYYGGGIYCEGASPRIENCHFTANSAYYRGGGLYCRMSEAEIVGCLFTENEGGDGGGGGMGTYLSDVSLSGCIFRGNSGMDGGGIWFSGGSPTVSHCLFAGNDAMFWGGGIVCSGASPLISQCTFIANDANEGGGIWLVSDSSPAIENCIFAFNVDGSGIWVNDDGCVPSFVCCDFYDNEGSNYGGQIEDQTGFDGNISSHPLFCDQDDGDYTLSLGSPCLPENNECGVLMGAYGLGCENPTSVPGDGPGSEDASWSRVKALF